MFCLFWKSRRLSLWHNAQCVGMDQCNALHRVFASHLCHSWQTHRFRHCSQIAMGAFEYLKTNFRNDNKGELYFYFTLILSRLSALAPFIHISIYFIVPLLFIVTYSFRLWRVYFVFHFFLSSTAYQVSLLIHSLHCLYFWQKTFIFTVCVNYIEVLPFVCYHHQWYLSGSPPVFQTCSSILMWTAFG